MKNKIFSKFLVPILIVGLFGFVSLVYGQSDTSTTSTSISNLAPTFTAHTVESWVQTYTGSATTEPRSESSATYPTNQGTDVTFTATAHDDNSNDYYLIVCDAAGVTAGSEAAPTCTGSQICVSSATTTDTAASCNYDTTSESNESVDWYAYVCDHNTNALCSSVSNTSDGEDYAEGGKEAGDDDYGSPFHVNHAPTFTAGNITNELELDIEPNSTILFTNASNGDLDTDEGQDLINLYICSGESDMGGVTTAFDFYNKTCTGGTLLCQMNSNHPGNPAWCSDTQNIVAAPTAEATDYTVYYYLDDEHGFSAAVDPQDFTVIDVHPTLVANTIDSSMPTIGRRRKWHRYSQRCLRRSER